MTQRSLERIPLLDGTRLPLTVATPDSAVRGGILVGPRSHGVTDSVWRLAAGLAADGWLAVIPHLYHRDNLDDLPLGDENTVSGHVNRLTAGSLRADTDATLRWLARQGVSDDRIGAVGVELGGTVALIAATQNDLGAAVSISGIGVLTPVAPTLPALVDIAPQLRCPWLGIYLQDGGVCEAEVHKLRDAAHSAPVATDLVHCPVDTDQILAPELWARTLNWFGSHLR